jgi:hypothetical protein
MQTPYEAEGTASRRVNHVDDQRDGQAQPSNHTAPGSAAPVCATNFPMLTPHEIATLMLIAHTPDQVSIEWPDLPPLLSGNLVKIDKCLRCRGIPHVTPLGENLVVRLYKTTRRGIRRHIFKP